MPEQRLPNYEVSPLRSDEITVAVFQTRMKTIDATNPARGIKENLDHMLQYIDRIQARRPRDLLVFHEFPLQGSNIRWTREEQMRVAIDVPGEETDIVGERARRYNCYICFGARGRLADWPGHFFYFGLIVGPSGKIVQTRWKLRNMPGIGYPTTVFDVLDQYVERYGWDAVFPVSRTDIGNLCLLPEVLEPELARVFGIKGTEIVIRYMTNGAGHWSTPLAWGKGGSGDTYRVDLQSVCAQNSIYGVFVNTAISVEDLIQDFGMGGSAIYDFDGRVVEQAASPFSSVIEATIPIASYRRNHSIPNFPVELVRHAFGQFSSKYPPNLFAETLPASNTDSIKLYQSHARW